MVRLNRNRVEKPGHVLRQGDVLTLTLRGGVRVVKVLAEAGRRGAAADAKLLYEDLMPLQPAASQGENLRA